MRKKKNVFSFLLRHRADIFAVIKSFERARTIAIEMRERLANDFLIFSLARIYGIILYVKYDKFELSFYRLFTTNEPYVHDFIKLVNL